MEPVTHKRLEEFFRKWAGPMAAAVGELADILTAETRIAQATATVPDSNAEGPFVSAEEIAKMLGVSQTLIYTEVRKNRLPHVRIGSAIRLSPEQVSKALRERQAAPEGMVKDRHPPTPHHAGLRPVDKERNR